MKVLVTGGSGFIGTHLISKLSSSGKYSEIINLDIKTPDKKIMGVKNYLVDIRDYSQLDQLDLPDIDLCIHLAALCKEPGFEWDEYFETNLSGTTNLIRFCREKDISKIVFTSTMMVYKAGEIERLEDSLTSPDTAYGTSKLLAEKELEQWKISVDGWLKIIRPAVVFGKFENGNFTRLYRSLKKGFFPLIGKKTTIKSNIYVHELVSFIEFLIETGTTEDIYNFSFPEKHTMERIIKHFKATFGFKPFTPVLPYRLMIFAAYLFEILNSIGIRNPVHHRRIQKLYYSTDIKPTNALKEGYEFRYDLPGALDHWKDECAPQDIS